MNIAKKENSIAPEAIEESKLDEAKVPVLKD